MTDKNFKKATLKAIPSTPAIYMTDGVQKFPSSVVSVLQSVHAWNSLGFVTKYCTIQADHYIVFAYNGGYFKTDGQEMCVHYFIYDKTTKDAWLNCCLCPFNNTDALNDIADIVKRIKTNIDKFETHEDGGKAELIKMAEKQKQEYCWEISGIRDGNTATYQYWKEQDNLAKIPTPENIAERFVKKMSDKHIPKDVIKELAAEIEEYHQKKLNPSIA